MHFYVKRVALNLIFSYLCQKIRQELGLPLVVDMLHDGRKVRATQDIPLPNGKRLARVCRCRRKQPPPLAVRVRRWGKGPPGQWRHWCCASRELKVHVNQRTQREGCPSELEGRTIEAAGDGGSR